MFKETPAYASFAVKDIGEAKSFYGGVLGLNIREEQMGVLALRLGSGAEMIVYPKPDHVPATFTVLNFDVPDIGRAVDELGTKGVSFERYEGFSQDHQGISRDSGGPAIAWFKDPSGNILSVMQSGR